VNCKASVAFIRHVIALLGSLTVACGSASSESAADASADATAGKIPPGWTDPSGGAPATACERTLPIDGSSCVGSLDCSYPGNTYCAGDSAKCVGGVWRVTLGACTKCPPPSDPRPADGSSCSGGKGCRFLNACGGVDIGQCVDGWRIVPGACHKACPPIRPTPGSTCAAISADVCNFAGTECSTSACSCIASCPTICADGVVLKWSCPEPSCGPTPD